MVIIRFSRLSYFLYGNKGKYWLDYEHNTYTLTRTFTSTKSVLNFIHHNAKKSFTNLSYILK